MKRSTKKFTLESFLFLITFLSFLAIVLFSVFFVIYAPGHYEWDTDVRSLSSKIVDIIFAILLLISNVCCIFSFCLVLKVIYDLIRGKRKASMIQFKNILLGLYPILCVFFLCSGNFDTFLEYLISPIKLLSML